MAEERRSMHMPRLIADNTNLIIAGTAIDRAIILRQEWYLRLRTAFGTNNCVHFSRGALRTVSNTARRIATGSTAGRAAAGLVHQPLLLVELLFTCGECEIISTFATLKGFVDEAQLGTSL